jgi:hypothetical protein
MTTKRLSALEVWALAMDFGLPAADATPDAHQGVAAPAPTPAREAAVIGSFTLDAEEQS